MRTIIKLFGILAVVFACSGYGFLRAAQLRRRVKMLSQFKTCLEELKCRIGAERTELDEALGYAFYNSECITVSQGKIIRFDVSLNQKDKQIIKELINGMGSLDVSAELERIAFYGELVEVALKEALCDSKEKAKIFQTAGISIGVTAGIMML